MQYLLSPPANPSVEQLGHKVVSSYADIDESGAFAQSQGHSAEPDAMLDILPHAPLPDDGHLINSSSTANDLTCNTSRSRSECSDRCDDQSFASHLDCE